MPEWISRYLEDLFDDLGSGRRVVDLADPYSQRRLADEAADTISAMVEDWWVN